MRTHYVPLDEEIEFDRGSKKDQIIREIRRVYGRTRLNLTLWINRFLRSAGFMLDDSDSYLPRVSVSTFVEDPPIVNHFSHNLFLALAALSLVFVTASEPVILKIMADHSQTIGGDYRYILAQLVTLFHLPLCLASTIWYSCKYSTTAIESCDFPKKWFVILAFLNALHMIMLVVSCGSVPANLTILLVHANIPFTILISSVATVLRYLYDAWFPDPTYSMPQRYARRDDPNDIDEEADDSIAESCKNVCSHSYAYLCEKFKVEWNSVATSLLLVLGLVIGLFPVLSRKESALGPRSFCYQFNADCASSAITFMMSSVPAAISSVCEEIALATYSVPVAPIILHGWLVPMQFLFGIMLAPIGRHLQHPSDEWTNVTAELDGLGNELGPALNCILFGKVTGVRVVGMFDPHWCRPLPPLLIIFIAISVMFHILTLYVIKNGSELLLRVCAALAIPFGWSMLALYDSNFQPKVDPIIPTQDTISWYSHVSMLLVMFGVLFHRTTVEPETDYILTSRTEEQERHYIEQAAAEHRQRLMEATTNPGSNRNLVGMMDTAVAPSISGGGPSHYQNYRSESHELVPVPLNEDSIDHESEVQDDDVEDPDAIF